MKNLKRVMMIFSLVLLTSCVWGCGAVEKEEPEVPTKYIEKADDAVDEYNENVDKLNQTGNNVEDDAQE